MQDNSVETITQTKSDHLNLDSSEANTFSQTTSTETTANRSSENPQKKEENIMEPKLSTSSVGRNSGSPKNRDSQLSGSNDNSSRNSNSSLAALKKKPSPLDRISLMKSVNGVINLEFEIDEAMEGVDISNWAEFSKEKTQADSVKMKRGHGSFECARSEEGSEAGSPNEPSSPLYRDVKCRSIDGFDSPIKRRGSEEIEEKKKEQKLSLADFTKLRTLGKGSYAEVSLVQQNSDGKVYALKSIDKNFMVKEGKQYQVYVEKEVLSLLDHPNIIKLHSTFYEKNKLYFVLEYVAGGEFADYLKQYKKLPKEQAIFFSAEIISMLEYLHSQGIAHRDLKPENILLTTDGHLKAIDFGTARYIDSKIRMSELFADEKSQNDYHPNHRQTFVGTAQYVSPEMLGDQECGAPADIWALGVMLYQMAVGTYPFFEASEYLTFQKIQNSDPNYPSGIDTQLKDLIQKLLVKEPSKRLGAGPKGSMNDYTMLKNHQLFKGFEWSNLTEMKPPVFEITGPKKKTSNGENGAINKNDILTRKSEDTHDRPKELVKKNSTEIQDKQVPSIIDKNISIVLSGLVEKKCGWIFYKPRQLIMNSKPRLMYYDPNTNQLRGEIHLAPETKAELESKTKFTITTPLRKYKFKQIEHAAEKWVNLINDTIAKLYAKK